MHIASPEGTGALTGNRGQGRLSHTRWLIAGSAAVLFSILSLAGYLLWDARNVAWRHAVQFSENVASAIEHDIERNIELYDLSLRTVVKGLALPNLGSLDPDLRKQVLFDGAGAARHLGAMVVLDESGRVTIASQDQPAVGTDFADRDFFRIQRDKAHTGLYIGTPFQAEPTGAWAIALSRRIELPDGSFAGVVFGTLRLEFFDQLFALINPGEGGAITLYRTDGVLIDRMPFSEPLIGADFNGSPIFPNTDEVAAGIFASVSPLDGIDRIYAYRQIGKLPLLLTVGISRAAAFGEWTQKALGILISMLALSALVLGLGAALAAELRRRGRAERTARDSERRYRLLAEHSVDMIVRFDPVTQKRTYVSPACRLLYGYEPEEAGALSAEAIIHPEDLPAVRHAIKRLDAGEHRPVMYRGRRKDGTYIWVEASLTRSADPDTGAPEIVSIVRDVGERVRYERALHEAKEAADAASRSKSAFLATMSHELRTPLNAIIGFTDLMRHELMGPIGNSQYRAYVEDIHLSGTHLLELINDILDLSKAEAGKLDLQEELVDIEEAVRSVVRVSKTSIDKAELKVEIDLPADLPLLRVDERRTRQVFFNLIGNAVKFTRAGGAIAISGDFDPRSGLRITVADTGIGIAPEDLDRVLEPFVQIDNALSRSHSGTGLGLPAVKAIMELHSGSLELASSLGRGTEAAVLFPAARAVEREAPALALSAA